MDEQRGFAQVNFNGEAGLLAFFRRRFRLHVLSSLQDSSRLDGTAPWGSCNLSWLLAQLDSDLVAFTEQLRLVFSADEIDRKAFVDLPLDPVGGFADVVRTVWRPPFQKETMAIRN